MGEQGVEQEAGAGLAVRRDQGVEGFAPLGRFGGVEVGGAVAEDGADVAGERKVGHGAILPIAPASVTGRNG
ncbi:MAG: hypothetical protein ACXWCU_18140 [Caldimonas sp.]